MFLLHVFSIYHYINERQQLPRSRGIPYLASQQILFKGKAGVTPEILFRKAFLEPAGQGQQPFLIFRLEARISSITASVKG